MNRNLIETKAKIGFMSIGLKAYWPQFPEVRDGITSYHDRLAKKFEGSGILVDAGLVDCMESSKKAGRLFCSEDVDIIFCHTATYSPSANLLPAIKDLKVPVIFLNVQCVKSLDMDSVTTIGEWLGNGFTVGCVPEMTAVCRRSGKRFDVITGYMDGDAIVDEEIKQWCTAAGVRARLRHTGIALLGRPYPGMMDLYIDETGLFNKIGCYTEYIEWDDIKNELPKVSAEEAGHMADVILQTFDIRGNASREGLGKLPAITCALERVALKYNVSAVASHYAGDPKGEDAVIFSALNPAFSILINEGISSAVEGDIKSALAMTILRNSGGSATLAELYSMDFNNDICLIGHSGSGDPAVSISKKPVMEISSVFHGKTTGGYLTQFYPEYGDVTLLSLTQDETGGYRMACAKGSCVEGPILKLGDTNSRISFSCGMRKFVNSWCSSGPTHHGVLGLGNNIGILKKVSVALDMPIDIICE